MQKSPDIKPSDHSLESTTSLNDLTDIGVILDLVEAQILLQDNSEPTQLLLGSLRAESQNDPGHLYYKLLLFYIASRLGQGEIVEMTPEKVSAQDVILGALEEIVSELRSVKTKQQPTKLEQIIGIFRARLLDGKLLKIDDIVYLFPESGNPRQTARKALDDLEHKLGKHGVHLRTTQIHGFYLEVE